ncbi:MAG: hypothetical protein AAFW68_01360 [Pseudomonadota bacterium]
MLLFRIFLIAVFITIAIYTLIVGLNHGWNLVPVFFGDISQLAWPGQFNLDFLTFLLLAALWVMWRHEFSSAGIGFGLMTMACGMLFLSAYLLTVSFRVNGDVRALLLGGRTHVS